jgi:uncharacterized spore protein YtfJ
MVRPTEGEAAMTRAQDEAMAAAQKSAPADQLLERIAELLGAKATVQVVFGEPIRQGDLTVVPVAKVRWGFGGGGGRSEEGESQPAATGSGGGGGVAAEPVGYLEISGESAEFRPIRDPYPSPLFLLAAGISAAIVLRTLMRLLGR